jgi:hypothetical protein
VVATPRAIPASLTADLVVELPTRGWVEDAAAIYRGTLHKRRVVNGYSGYLPPHYAVLQRDLRNHCVRSLEAIRGGRSLDVVVWRADADFARVDAAVRRLWATAPREEMADVIVYRVPRSRDGIPDFDFGPPANLKPLCEG